ncbi:hypothetical protein JCM6882_007727 [Rhodosporidiobolus microsporus]
MALPLSAQTSYKKTAGTLTLSQHALAFTPSSTPSPSLSIPTSLMSALFASKPGGARTMLKVQFAPLNTGSNDDSHNFVFTSPTSQLQDRDRFKDELSAVIARNRERDALAATGGGAAGAGAGGASTAAKATASAKGKERAVDSPAASARPSPSTNSTPAPPGSSTTSTSGAPSTDFRLRKSVLQSDPTLLALHRDLVLSGALTESEFWESGRAAELLAAYAAEESLMRGKSGEMVDPKTVTGQNGEVTVKITPALIREIFEEFPVVLRAYNENVPEPLSESLFWTRYFQSKLFNRNRTTNRAAVDAIKDDAIFDRYLGEEDDGVEPQHVFEEGAVWRLLDLKASEEDQHEAPTLPRDHTMKPGGQRASLPLMRRFNEHSERLLNQALGSAGAGAARERGYVDPGNAGDRSYYSAIELSDLTAPHEPERVLLTLSNPSNPAASSSNPAASTSGAAGGVADAEGEAEGGALGERWERREAQRRVREEVGEEWDARLDEFQVDAAATRDAMRDMTASIAEGAERSRKTGSSGGLPRAHLLPLTTLSTSTFEILRHFWSALLPPPPSLPLSQQPTPQARAARVEKFRAYLEKSLERIRAAEEGARKDAAGEEVARRVESAVGTVKGAVEAALAEYKRRMGPGGAGGGGGASRGGTPRPPQRVATPVAPAPAAAA